MDATQPARHNPQRVLEEQVAERTSALAMLRDIASMSNHAHDVEQALEFCLRRVAAHNSWTFGHAYLPAATDPDLLLPTYTWYPPEASHFEHFRELTLRTPLRIGQGLPGAVFESGRAAWSTEIAVELSHRRTAAAVLSGIATILAFPVMAEQRVVGVLEFFSDKTIQPTSELLESMSSIGMQIGRVIERNAFQNHLLTLAEKQHQQIGQQLHDDIGQEMTGLALKCETLAEMLNDQQPPATKLSHVIVTAVDRTRRKIQALSQGLIPTDIEGPALASALDELAYRTDKAREIRCRFRNHEVGCPIDNHTATQLYRIAQEAVINAQRYNRGTEVEIALTGGDANTILEIRDSGVGTQAAGLQMSTLALQIMRYRAKLIGGSLTVDLPPAGGSCMTCCVPHPKSKEDD